VRFEQQYKGIPVYGYSVAATQSSMGQLSNVQGQILDLGKRPLLTKPFISAKQAINDLIDAHKSQNESSESTNVAAIYNRQNELYIYLHNGAPTLVNRISYVIPGQEGIKPTRIVYFVDAMSGETLFTYDNMQHIDIGIGPGGNVNTGQPTPLDAL
jgi:vibriolysin